MPDERAIDREVHCHQGHGWKSGGCAQKAVELTSGGLPLVAENATEGEVILPDPATEVSRGRSTSGSRRKAQTMRSGQ